MLEKIETLLTEYGSTKRSGAFVAGILAIIANGVFHWGLSDAVIEKLAEIVMTFIAFSNVHAAAGKFALGKATEAAAAAVAAPRTPEQDAAVLAGGK